MQVEDGGEEGEKKNGSFENRMDAETVDIERPAGGELGSIYVSVGVAP